MPPTTAAPARTRRSLPARWLVALVGVPLVLGGLGAQVSKGSIESELKTKATSALQGIGASDAKLTVQGRDLTITPGAQVDSSRIEQALLAIPGVRAVTVKDGTP